MGGGGGVGSFTLCWFSPNNSEKVHVVTLTLCSIKSHFIREIRAKFGIHNSSQSPVIGQNSDGGISDFRISGQSLIKENCHNTSNGIDMKVGPVNLIRETKRQKRLLMASC